MSDDSLDSDVTTLGWDAIDGALKSIYGDQEPKHFGTLIKYFMGGPDPLDGISAYKRLEPTPHWHYVSYGLSELYDKTSTDPNISGYGLELTFRLACAHDEEEPPTWPMNLMQNLARYVFQTGNDFIPGQWGNLNGPIMLGSDTLLCSIAFIEDPELGEIQTPYGSVDFLQIVGLTQDEEDAGKNWSIAKLLEVFAPHMPPLYINDIGRTSMMLHADVQQAVDDGIKTDGSSTGEIFTNSVQWSEQKRLFRKPIVTLEVGAGPITELLQLLPMRLPFDKDVKLISGDKLAGFSASDTNRAETKGSLLFIDLTPESLNAFLRQVKPHAGTYDIEGTNLRMVVTQTKIRNADGNIIEVIG